MFNPFIIFRCDERISTYSFIRICLERLSGLILSCLIPSAFSTMLNVFGQINRAKYMLICLSIGTVIFIYYNYRMQRKYFLSLDGDFSKYSSTFVSCFLFSAICIAMYFINYEVFCWGFSITTFLVLPMFQIITLKAIIPIIIYIVIILALFATAHIKMINVIKENKRIMKLMNREFGNEIE